MIFLENKYFSKRDNKWKPQKTNIFFPHTIKETIYFQQMNVPFFPLKGFSVPKTVSKYAIRIDVKIDVLYPNMSLKILPMPQRGKISSHWKKKFSGPICLQAFRMEWNREGRLFIVNAGDTTDL